MSGTFNFPTPQHVVEHRVNAIHFGHITMDGQRTEFDLQTANVGPQGLALWPDGSLWFTQQEGGKSGVMPRVVGERA